MLMYVRESIKGEREREVVNRGEKERGRDVGRGSDGGRRRKTERRNKGNRK